KLAGHGFAGVILDTGAPGRRLLDHVDVATLGRVVGAARANGLTIGLAGSLEPPDIPRILLLEPDVVCLRGPLDARSVAVARALIQRDARAAAPAARDTARLVQRLPRREEVATDRIFVRDFVLPISIGAYAHERNKRQKVRFDVEAQVLRGDHPAADM